MHREEALKESSGEGETLQSVPRPPMTIRQSPQEMVAVPRSSWERIEARVMQMPEPPTIWLGLAGALAAMSVERHDESSLLTGAGSLLCYLAHRAITKGARRVRADIVDEMRLHAPARDGGRGRR